MLEYQPNIVLSEKDYAVVGKRPIRPDGIAKVTGRATYGADIRLPGMLYGKILRSPYAHARIKSTLIGSRALAACGDVDGPSAANNRPWSRK
jgi:CO/xanthine dehydrogenase Mo-binding subunit